MTNYYRCDVCDKTMSQNDTIPKFEATGATYLCYKCLNPTDFAFSVCTADSPEPSLGFCDGCDELEAELHLVDGDWLCDTCKATVIKSTKLSTQGYWCRATGEQIKPQDVEPYGHPKHGLIDVCPCHHLELVRKKPAPRESDTKLLCEELQDVEKGCIDYWEMVKACVFITLFLVWVCFAVWGKYAIGH